MEYPNRLLPKPQYKRIPWHESLRDHFLIHYTDQEEIIDPNTNKLHIKHVVKRTDHLRDYSNNLLGVFLVDDIYWALQDCQDKDYFTAEWEEGTDVKKPKVPDEYDREESRGYFFLNIGDCHEVAVEFEDDQCRNSDPVCMVFHTPTNSNFWHFSLRWFFDGEDLESGTDGIKRRMKTSAKAFIIENAFFKEPYYEEIDSVHYTN